MDMLSCLLCAGALVCISASHTGTTALHAAVEAGQGEVVQLLLGEGVDINTCNVYGLSPLNIAETLNRRDIL